MNLGNTQGGAGSNSGGGQAGIPQNSWMGLTSNLSRGGLQQSMGGIPNGMQLPNQMYTSPQQSAVPAMFNGMLNNNDTGQQDAQLAIQQLLMRLGGLGNNPTQLPNTQFGQISPFDRRMSNPGFLNKMAMLGGERRDY